MGKSGNGIQTRKKEEETVNRQQGSGVRCPECGGRSHVNNSVPVPKESIMKRYRECDNCHTRFLTEETIIRTTVPRK